MADYTQSLSVRRALIMPCPHPPCTACCSCPLPQRGGAGRYRQYEPWSHWRCSGYHCHGWITDLLILQLPVHEAWSF